MFCLLGGGVGVGRSVLWPVLTMYQLNIVDQSNQSFACCLPLFLIFVSRRLFRRCSSCFPVCLSICWRRVCREVAIVNLG